ncbi:MAG TPA: T9SS type A sorting domain-containing protein [Flavipsychrobacter sp.]|nr:T9SS type A sorting domain-containing protein [Flavipsychrobacter sp.]
MIPVKLGTQAYPMNDILGLGAEIKILGMPMATPLHIDHSYQTWIGYYSSINFEQVISNYHTDFVHCRYDHFPRSGFGTIGHLFLNIPASAAGDTATLYFDNVVIIDSAGNVLTNYNVLPATFIIKDPLGIKRMQSVINEATIIPNPSATKAELLIRLNENTKLFLTLTDVAGRTIWETNLQLSQGEHRIDLPRTLSPGVYQVAVHGQDAGTQKTLKWIKQ